MTWTVYILECSDGSYYTGITKNLSRRITQHQTGVGAKYTKGRTPIKLIYQEAYKDRSKATKREMEIMALKKIEKQRLVYN
ncbi:MAG: GIY-YIG nuclease family protein [Pseudomonadota bacterium]|nr:GIY-YIG nuclease family protein [Pseudomonadota bacterium]